MDEAAIAATTQNIAGIYAHVNPMMNQNLAELVRTGAI